MDFNSHSDHDVYPVELEIPAEKEFKPWGGAHEFVRQYAESPEMQGNPALQKLHKALINQASVCSFCGVGCPPVSAGAFALPSYCLLDLSLVAPHTLIHPRLRPHVSKRL